MTELSKQDWHTAWYILAHLVQEHKEIIGVFKYCSFKSKYIFHNYKSEFRQDVKLD